MASKKWKKRLKKIGKVAAIAGAAALAAKLASKRRRASIAGMDDAGIGVTHPALTGGDTGGGYITRKVAEDAASPVRRSYLSRMSGAAPLGEYVGQAKRAGTSVVNPHEATAAAGAAYNPNQVIRGRINRNVVYKHGGRVTGIAKRGFGRALMKGKK